MSASRTRARLTAFHRWVGLATSPIFAIILLSGLVLAVVGDDAPSPVELDAARLEATLARIDPAETATGLRIDAGGGRVAVKGADGAEKVYDLSSGAERPASEMPADTVGFWKTLHARLGGIGDGPVKIVTLLVTLAMIAAPFLGRPRSGRTVIGRHVLVGWLLFPLAAWTPVTGAMLALHIGDPAGVPHFDRAGTPVSPEAAIRAGLGAGVELTGLVSVDRFHGGPAVLTTWETEGRVTRVVDASGAIAKVGGESLVSRLHEGSWAEPWSRLLSVASVLSLIYLLAGGARSWIRRKLPRASA